MCVIARNIYIYIYIYIYIANERGRTEWRKGSGVSCFIKDIVNNVVSDRKGKRKRMKQKNVHDMIELSEKCLCFCPCLSLLFHFHFSKILSHLIYVYIYIYTYIYIYIYIDTATRVQILDETNCISHSNSTLGKGRNPIILPPAMGK